MQPGKECWQRYKQEEVNNGASDMNPFDPIAEGEVELLQVVEKMCSSGIRYEVVADILIEIAKSIKMRGYCDEWLEQNNPGGRNKVK